MNYGKNEVEKTLRKTNSRSQKITSHLVLLLTKIILILVLFAAVLGISFGYGIFKGVIDAAPEIDVASIEPSGYATMVYDSKGNLTETLVKSGANRLEASYEELPQCLIDAFVAIEDSRFWSHKGVDVRSMVRAAVGIITGDSSAGGGSTLTQQLQPSMTIKQEGAELLVSRPDDGKENRALHGLTRALLHNMVVGVSEGFKKELEVNGIGYRAAKEGKNLVMNLGYSHQVIVPEIDGITIDVPAQNKIVISGPDKQKVGQFAAEVREKRPPEPYKGKGIKYVDEVIRRKVGKTGAKK
jgi:large subunit ribosomal protein L6